MGRRAGGHRSSGSLRMWQSSSGSGIACWKTLACGGLAELERRRVVVPAPTDSSEEAAFGPICLDSMEPAPRCADAPVRLLASHRDLYGLGVDADALRLPAHLFGVFAGHRGTEVVKYCREKLQVLLR